MDNVAGFTILGALDVRHAACGVDDFAQQVTELLLDDRPVIVDLSAQEDHGNRILLRARREDEER